MKKIICLLILINIFQCYTVLSKEPGFNKLHDNIDGIFNAPCSSFFGISSDGGKRNPQSFYKPEGAMFSVSNNKLLYRISEKGLISRGLITQKNFKGPLEGLRGASYTRRKNIYGKEYILKYRTGNSDFSLLHEVKKIQVDLLHNLFPLYTYNLKSSKLKLLAFAPTENATGVSPSAIMFILQVENNDKKEKSFEFLLPEEIPIASKRGLSSLMGNESQLIFEYGKHSVKQNTVKMRVKPGQKGWFSFCLCLTENASDLKQTFDNLKKHKTCGWFNNTLEFHQSRLGQLEIPEEPFFAELYVRFAEMCRQTLYRNAKGEVVGGDIGTQVRQEGQTWMKDNFYAALPQSFLYPSLCADAITYLQKWSTPDSAYGRGLHRFPDAPNVLHSLSNTLSPYILSGLYYRYTNDKDYFIEHPELLKSAEDVFNRILSTRPKNIYKDMSLFYPEIAKVSGKKADGTPFLFHSMYISDGDARGDYHTGSNVLVWFSLKNMALIAAEVYGNTNLSQEWNAIADKVKQDIFTYCIGEGIDGKRFFEGVNWDYTHVWANDGEESDVALMPFYGLCSQDFEPLINHSKAGLTIQNPYYSPDVDGVNWFDSPGHWHCGVTFPPWVSALAGVSSEKELLPRLNRIRQMTDVDGSIWWWAYEYGEKNIKNVRREITNSSWSAACYLSIFTNNILGLKIDKDNILFKPFCPWNSFAWEGCKLGNTKLDVQYKKGDDKISSIIKNLNKVIKTVTIELTLPEGKDLLNCRVNNEEFSNYSISTYYNRTSVIIQQTLKPNEKICFEALYKPE